MLPFWSTARLPTQRETPSLPRSPKIPCCTGDAATVPPDTFSCAHWTPLGPLEEVRTVWFTQSDSAPASTRYWSWLITRSGTESRLLPGVATVDVAES